MLKDKTDNMIVYIIGFLIIIFSGGIWPYFYGKYFEIIYIAVAMVILLVLIKDYLLDTFKLLIPVGFVIAYLSFELVFYSESFDGYTYFLRNLILLFLVALFLYKKKVSILTCLTKVLYHYNYICFILYIIIFILNINIPHNIVQNSGFNVNTYTSYMNLSYYHQIVYISDKLFIRNNGIFYEPCYLGMYISLFLVNELFYRDKIRLIAVIVACFNLFTTMSTTALIFVVAIFLVKFYTLKFDNRLIKLLKNIFIPIITFACGVVAIYIYISKVQGFGKLSYGIRQEDFLLGLKLFKERIIAGWGFDNLNAIIFLESSDLRGNGLGSNWGSSNGLTLLMYQGGLYFLMVYVTGIYYYFKDLYLKNKIGSLILLSWLILFLISEPIQYNRLIIFFVVYGILIRYYDVFKNRAEKMYFS